MPPEVLQITCNDVEYANLVLDSSFLYNVATHTTEKDYNNLDLCAKNVNYVKVRRIKFEKNQPPEFEKKYHRNRSH